MDKPLFTLNVATKAYEPDGRLDAVNAATPDSSVQYFDLTSQEVSVLGLEVITNLQIAAIRAVGQLPDSVLRFFLTSVASVILNEPLR
jgi:hypothetical protein